MAPDWQKVAQNAEHVVAGTAVVYALYRAVKGFSLSGIIAAVPGAQGLLDAAMQKDVDDSVQQFFRHAGEAGKLENSIVPLKGLSSNEVRSQLKRLQGDGVRKGRIWAYVYDSDYEDQHKLIEDAYTMYMHMNGLNPAVFPMLRKFEVEVLQMAANLLGAQQCKTQVCGSMTTGGTESILMAIKTYREQGRAERPHITKPNMIAPITIHPAFEKAAHYFDVEIRHAPLKGDDCELDLEAYEALIDANTILLIGSAPQYPHGSVDPIEDIVALSKKHNTLGVHVDACVGGFMLPFVRQIGFPVPKFDFSIDGVTSMSADIHKYGYAAKGASVVLYNRPELRMHQYYAYCEWPGGLFVSPSMTGTRSGGAIAAAWATLMRMGQDGYQKVARKVMATRDFLIKEVNKIDGLKVIGKPVMSIVTFRSTDPAINIYAVADVMEDSHGWTLEKQQSPPSIHCSVMPPHAETKDKFIADLKNAVAAVKKDPSLAKKGAAATYGMVSTIPDGAIVDRFLTMWMDKVFRFN